MADRCAARFAVCPSGDLADGQHRKLSLTFEGKTEECLLLRFDGQVYAYLNRCVHMPRRLDGEAPQVFDQSGRFLRCSMHGIVYVPQTGASVSSMCEGERLRAVDCYEDDGEIGIADFRVSAMTATPSSAESAMPVTTVDCQGAIVRLGDRVRVLDITLDPDLDEDDLEMFRDMVGAVCAIERIDGDGAAWVALWWNGDEGTVLTQVGLAPWQMARVAA